MNIYGALALVLAALGVYGVLSAGVASRRRELGIRAALGAAPGRLLAGVVREGLLVATIAIGCGLALTWAVGRTVSTWIFAASPTDPRLLLATTALLLAAALGASALPARKAARIDPARVLRSDQ